MTWQEWTLIITTLGFVSMSVVAIFFRYMSYSLMDEQAKLLNFLRIVLKSDKNLNQMREFIKTTTVTENEGD